MKIQQGELNAARMGERQNLCLYLENYVVVEAFFDLEKNSAKRNQHMLMRFILRRYRITGVKDRPRTFCCSSEPSS